MTKTCGKPCPEHNIECSVVPTPFEMVELEIMLTGKKSSYIHHSHLCSSPEHTHTWRDQLYV